MLSALQEARLHGNMGRELAPTCRAGNTHMRTRAQTQRQTETHAPSFFIMVVNASVIPE